MERPGLAVLTLALVIVGVARPAAPDRARGEVLRDSPTEDCGSEPREDLVRERRAHRGATCAQADGLVLEGSAPGRLTIP